MQLPGLIGFISVLILACNSDDNGWKINVKRNVPADSGNVIIQCNFSYPEKYSTNNVQVHWKIKLTDKSNCSINDNDKNAFVYHPNETCVLGKYKQKTKLIGDKDKGNCSLQIVNIEREDQRLYVRIIVNKEQYSYNKEYVTVSSNGADTVNTVATELSPAFSFTGTTIKKDLESPDVATTLYVAIPVAVVAVSVLLVAGIFIFQKRKRSLNLTREESGYYANFSRALSNPPKSESSGNTQDKKLPERKAIDDPVYINVKAPPGHMDQNVDCVDNIYANMDYTN